MDKKFVLALLGFCLVVTACAPKTRVREEQARSIKETKTRESQYSGPKRRIGVLAFDNKTNYGEEQLGIAASDVLLTELVKSGKFVVIEREKINEIIKEQNLGKAGMIDERTAAKAGRILGLNAVVTGSISQFGAKKEGSDYLVVRSKQKVIEATVDIRLVDVESGEIIYADSGKGVSKKKTGQVLGMGTRSSYDETMEGEALRAAIVKFTKNIVSQVNSRPWYCLVADVRGDNVYLKAGSSSGLDIGTKLSVFHLGQPIRDPETDRIIGYDEEEIGQLEVIRHANENLTIGKMKGAKLPVSNDICRL